jgi:methylaspartate mutase epsilon subunit
MLNGFPSVTYGVMGCRRVVETLERPLVVRTATPDFRLGAEIMLAAGYTGHSHGAMGDLAYTKDTSMEQIIHNWQYVDRLAAYYEDNGCPISREHYIPLCSVVPAGLQIVVTVIDGLLQLGQGANHCLLAYGQNGSLYQDIAALRVMREIGEEYAARLGYTKAVVTTSLHQWMGGFPEDEAKAYSIICAGAAVAAWGGATMTIVKTPDEAFGVPTREANVQGCLATRTMLEYAACSAFPETDQLQTEAEMLRSEARAVLDRVLELGEGDLAAGVVAAFKAGVIDIPFSPNQHNKALVMPVRDASGAFRYLDAGNIPLPAAVSKYHRQQIERRERLEGRKASYNTTIGDIYALSKGLPLGAARH